MGLHHYKIEMQLRDAELNQSDELFGQIGFHKVQRRVAMLSFFIGSDSDVGFVSHLANVNLGSFYVPA